MSSSADKAMKQRWTVAAATFAWIAAIVGPALTFDVSLTAAGDTGRMFTAFFQIVATCVFLLAVPRARKISTRTVWMLLAVAIVAFIGYALLREAWTCGYFDYGRLIVGTSLLNAARTFLVQRGMADSGCVEILSAYGGDSVRIWDRTELTIKFLALFALYCCSWLVLAFSIIGATSRRWSRA